jgi:membrane protein DedA with SNARE-associated domain
MLYLHEGRLGKTSILSVFIIVWVLLFATSHIGARPMPYGEFLLANALSSTILAFAIACYCFNARKGTRDPKEQTDGVTLAEI